ncbi:MAG: MarR family winged helix-turn-helix transcriptional regulator [Methyloligellaceae bacterium]
MRRLGLTRSQWLVLSRLHRRPGASQSELADMLEIEKATAGRLIDRLEENGWVERRPDTADRRINRIYMTAEAEKINIRMRPLARGMVEESLEGLSAEDREQLTDLMLHVKRRLQAMADAADGEGPQHGIEFEAQPG